MNSSFSKSQDTVQKSTVSSRIVDAWYRGAWWLYLLLPLSFLYIFITSIRRYFYRLGILSTYRSELPVIVVGNITLGGTGKSPLTSAIVMALKNAGYQPGIVSRGYGAEFDGEECREVAMTSSTNEVGDEPLMLKRMLDCPIYVSPKRSVAVRALENAGCDVVICDDGLQHYALQRDIEVCVFDGERGGGNGLLLPSGPLREGFSRVARADFVVLNGSDSLHSLRHDQTYRMDLLAVNAQKMGENEAVSLARFKGRRVHAVAAIGNPERFFLMLEDLGIEVIRHAFNDHHSFSEADLRFDEPLPIIMTEKDAVKCFHMSLDDAWYVPVKAQLDPMFFTQLIDKLKEVRS